MPERNYPSIEFEETAPGPSIAVEDVTESEIGQEIEEVQPT
jgi:hypothetical protein